MKYHQLINNTGNAMNGLTKRIILLLMALGTLCNTTSVHAIVNGEEATYGDYPWMVSIQIPSGGGLFHICGGVIWNNNYVVTAAHCMNPSNAGNYRVVAGNHRMSNTDAYQVTRSVSSITNHPQYNGNAPGYPNDISVLRLSSALAFNTHVNSIPFASLGVPIALGSTVTATGWGRLSGGGSLPNVLQQVDMPVISNSECASRWAGIAGASINSGHICFYEADAAPASACSGDDGGPAAELNAGLMAGVGSWGITSCSGAYPSVYTRVSSFYAWLVGIAGSQ